MHFSSKQEQLRQLLKEQHASLQQTFPTDRPQALLALVRASNRDYLEARHNSIVYHVSPTGLQKALSLSFSTANNRVDIPTDILDTWADSMLQACTRLSEAERVLDYCDIGFMHMQQDNHADYNVWVASKKMPTEWREHEDIVEWADFLKKTYATEICELQAEKVSVQQQLVGFGAQWSGQSSDLYRTTQAIDDYYYRLGMLHVRCMPTFTTYLASTRIGGCTFEVYRNVLAVLIGLALKHVDVCSIARKPYVVEPYNDILLIKAVAPVLTLDYETVRLALDVYTLDAENILYHTSTTSVPMPPLIRLDEQHCVASLEGLLTYPLFFLMRELKRKYSEEYHTASQVREEVFRRDIYALFADKRFVKSVGHVELRGPKGTLTTDVDALIFDRKTGALALFELKSQDPFAYSQQERIRQRDYFYNASKQVIASSEWVKRNGSHALLGRLDSAQVKRLKAQNVYIFVLGRYLAHFFDGLPFDGRAAWGTWSQMLRLVHGKPFGANDTNPIQSLHGKLMKDKPLALVDTSLAMQEIVIANKYIRAYSSFEAYRSSGVE